MSTRIWNTPQWAALREHVSTIDKTHLRQLLNERTLTAEYDGIFVDYSRQRVTPETMKKLYELADAADLRGKIAAMQSGKHINITEDRSVLHMALRAPADAAITVDGVNVSADVHNVLGRIRTFTDAVRSGKHVGATGKPLKDIVSIGIGGSYLGVEFVYEALRADPTAAASAGGRRLRFLANVDPVDVTRALDGLDPETTLVVIISKTFTTAETMLNARTVKSWLLKGLAGKAEDAKIVSHHVAAVSTAVPREYCTVG